MKLKGLVRFFAIALVIICLYQLSFTWMVHSYESNESKVAAKWVAKRMPLAPAAAYPNDKAAQMRYADTIEQYTKARLKFLLDSTKDTKIGLFGVTTYADAKDKELLLGLDLQGGMSVTMEVKMDDLLRSLANYTKDTAFNRALTAAVRQKAQSRTNLITLFYNQYTANNPQGQLAGLFAARSNNRLKFDASNVAVKNYLDEQATAAFQNTYEILRTRIDRFGLSSPNINADVTKEIISIELAGVTDPARVRRYLQSTANLQFFELYRVDEAFGNAFIGADKAAQDYLSGATDSTKQKNKKTITATTKKATINKPSTGNSILADINTAAQSTTDSTDSATNEKIKSNEYPLRRYITISQPRQDSKGNSFLPSELGYVRIKDTGALNTLLQLNVVKNKFPNTCVFMYGKQEANATGALRNMLPLYAIKTLDNGQAELEGEHVADAGQDYDENGRIAIKMNMDKQGTIIWAKMTQRNVGKPIAIVLDNIVQSAPNVNDPITSGNSQITGSYSVKEAQDLAQILKTGKLPAPAKIVQEQIVGPTLGSQAIHGGSLAFLISFVAIFLLMVLYYNTGGWVANIALVLNLLFTIGILSAFGFTLTAAGIAGLVLTIGMAVDTNVIIFERIKEELTRGKNYQTAVNDGYRRSLAPVLDAHITTFLTAFILFQFGLGPILGFATTQMLGIVLSLFCGILVSRLITDIYMNKQRHFNYFTGVSKAIFKHASFKFIEYRKVAYIISVVVLLLGISTFFRGFNQGVEFKGGRSYTIRFTQPIQPDLIRNNLKEHFNGEEPIIKTVGSNNQLNITTSYKITATAASTDSLVEATLYQGLLPYLPAGTTFQNFNKNFKQSSQTVQPSISDELKAGATKATIIAIVVICLYIFIRFRDWRYAVGTIVSLMHDVFVTLIVFSYFKNIVPFPLEIDQHFIAAVLTVIGFSMNDTVIVYDRIREDSKTMVGASITKIINRAINETLSRTIMTSLTVLLTILALFIFGGEITRGFAFAMLIGVVTGTYSSIFVAAPILVDFAKKKPLGSKLKKEEG